MALDGIFLSFAAGELAAALEGGRVDKIHQPERDEIVIVFRMRSGSERLLISSNASTPRIHLSSSGKENPMTPPNFCMLLRKHLSGAKFAGIRQPGLERIAFIDFDTHNDFGDEVRRTLAVEIMGRYSNIILINENGRILDAIKHVDETMSRERQILPSLLYELPPAQNKMNPLTTPPSEVIESIHASRVCELQKALLNTLQGISPVVCREISQLTCGNASSRTDELTEFQWSRLFAVLEVFSRCEGRPVMILDAKTRKPLDFSFMPVTQYGLSAKTVEYDTFSQLLEAFYTERDMINRIDQRSHDMLSMIAAASGRIERKLENQRSELSKSLGREQLRILGDLISANLHNLKKGMTNCEVANFYEQGEPIIKIELDPSLTPAHNAQKFYKEYRKAFMAEKMLGEQIASGEEELAYLDTVFDELSRAQSESSLAEIRDELAEEGYVKVRGSKSGKKKTGRISEPMRFISGDGFEILVGRNNRQNDLLTLKTADKNDMWLHTRNIPGAHVIISAHGEKVPDNTLTQAACLAAIHSKSKDSSQVPVDYTLARYVKKPSGAKPGKVIYEHFKTAFVNPDAQLAERLQFDKSKNQRLK